MKKVDERIPHEVGTGFYPSTPALRSPWGKLMDYRDAVHYATDYNSMLTVLQTDAFRILMPDYVERAKLMCEVSYASGRQSVLRIDEDGNNASISSHHIHPFCRGNFVGALQADWGDEMNAMCGRVNDFGSHRVEKELDECSWAIVGSDLCRQTISTLQGLCDQLADIQPQGGPRIEYSMVEAIGTGDRHCRVVAEDREKWPLPPRENWQGFGPIATEDYIKFTPEEDCVSEPAVLRADCDYTYVGGTKHEDNAFQLMGCIFCSAGLWYILPAVQEAIDRGIFTAEQYSYTLARVATAAGKASFQAPFAVEGVRQWLGVPHAIKERDGRILGGYIEMYLQCMRAPYEVEAFNEEEVIYVVDRASLSYGNELYVQTMLWYWFGAAKTLMSPQWSVWEEDSPEGKLRIRIGKKIDKYSL